MMDKSASTVEESVRKMEREIINEVKTDIALIKKDISQIQKIFNKIDNALDQMTSLTNIVSIQEKILEIHDKRISSSEDKLTMQADEEILFRKELSQKLDDMKSVNKSERDSQYTELKYAIENLHADINRKNTENDRRISALENWRWWMIGVGAVLVFLLNRIPWSVIF